LPHRDCPCLFLRVVGIGSLTDFPWDIFFKEVHGWIMSELTIIVNTLT